STSRIKFSYCRGVRNAPVGRPVQWMTPSRTLQVSGAQFAFTQPVRSRPLNMGTNPSSSAAKTRAAQATVIHAVRRNVFMPEDWTGPPGNARAPFIREPPPESRAGVPPAFGVSTFLEGQRGFQVSKRQGALNFGQAR